jgi:hypothetical protein
MVEDEILKMARRMHRRKPQIVQSIEAIVDPAKKAKNEKDVLEAMKFQMSNIWLKATLLNSRALARPLCK